MSEVSDHDRASLLARHRLAQATTAPADHDGVEPSPADPAEPWRSVRAEQLEPEPAVRVEPGPSVRVEPGPSVRVEPGPAVRVGSGFADPVEPWRSVRADPLVVPDASAPGVDPDGSGGMLARLSGRAFDPGRPGLRALAVVVLVVVLAAAALAWWSRPRPEPVVPQLAATAAAVAPATTEPVELVVAVSGMVHRPGLVRLQPGARVADAIEAAGGLLPDADVDHLNLARKVTDGELIAVGIPPPPGAGLPGGGDGSGSALVDLNTATQAELESLPGIGPALAQRIIDHRTTHGPFTSIEELRQVSGIGEVRFAELRDLVTV